MNRLTKYIAITVVGSLLAVSCGKKEPSLVFFPDMYYPVAYDPYQEAVVAYDDNANTVPLFASQGGQTAIAPVPGTIAQNKDGIQPLDLPAPPDATGGYAESKKITVSPLNPENRQKDLARGKDLYTKTCTACHGSLGDGQGSIVVSGAYSGVPDYNAREITVGSVYYVIEHGRNSMGSFAGHLLPGDRWRVAEYVMNEFKKQTQTNE